MDSNRIRDAKDRLLSLNSSLKKVIMKFSLYSLGSELDTGVLVVPDFDRAHQKITTFFEAKGKGLILIGNPGIGKSTYLFFALADRLSRKLETLLFYGDVLYLFASDGPYQSTSFKDHHEFWNDAWKGVWVLIDCKDAPPDALVHPHSRLFPIQNSSPKQARYKEWTKNRNAETVVTDPPDFSEVAKIVKRYLEVNNFDPLSEGDLQAMHLRPRKLEQFIWQTKTAIDGLGNDSLEKLVHSPESFGRRDPTSHKIVTTFRVEKFVSDQTVHRISSLEVYRMLRTAFTRVQLGERHKLSQMLHSSTRLGVPLGWLFESMAGDEFIKGGRFVACDVYSGEQNFLDIGTLDLTVFSN
ncbi:hypothetical protein D9757_002464 [Collybiopsis confluens]|uniref:Uncharacterized protein n=1 Tax=Collybiopsis confluens TaxID=2823264 RepID=A0A8H5HY87_9AGAR|nr:hypothetical protein D9757_002464 [Collybiopsis confluens]